MTFEGGGYNPEEERKRWAFRIHEMSDEELTDIGVHVRPKRTIIKTIFVELCTALVMCIGIAGIGIAHELKFPNLVKFAGMVVALIITLPALSFYRGYFKELFRNN